MAEAHYRRSELTWSQHGEPTAGVAVAADPASLVVNVNVITPDPHFSPRLTAPYLDNENPDINSNGIQIHLLPKEHHSMATATASLLLVPEERAESVAPGSVRVSAQSDFWRRSLLECSWQPATTGYSMALRLSRSALGSDFAMDIVVNLLASGRERRSGQLVMSGGHGGWIYLAGDRQSPSHFMNFRIVDA
jgi:hypothetical protein